MLDGDISFRTEYSMVSCSLYNVQLWVGVFVPIVVIVVVLLLLINSLQMTKQGIDLWV